MRLRYIVQFGVAACLALAVGACGSDTKKSKTNPAKEGEGGSGGGNNESSLATCDLTELGCEGMLGGLLAPCCVDENTCGIDTIIGGCQPLAVPAADAGPPDDSTIFLADGGAIDLQPDACEPISFGITALPGCCREDGSCGGSTHVLSTGFAALLGGGANAPPAQCATFEEIEALYEAQNSQFGDAGAGAGQFAGALEGIVQPPTDPGGTCTYDPDPRPTPDAGAPSDAGRSKPDANTTEPKVDASTSEPDSSTTPEPDGGNSTQTDSGSVSD